MVFECYLLIVLLRLLFKFVFCGCVLLFCCLFICIVLLWVCGDCLFAVDVFVVLLWFVVLNGGWLCCLGLFCFVIVCLC